MKVETNNLGGYTRSNQDTELSYDTGVVVMPVASRTAAHRLIRLHGGIGKRTVSWQYDRRGLPPIIPTMSDTTGDTFLGGSITPAIPQTSVTGKGYDWSVKGAYVFVQNTPRVVGTNAIPVGQHPYIDSQNWLPAVTLASQFLSSYTGAAPFHDFVERVSEAVVTDADGSYDWPILGLPTVFTSTHIIQD